MEIMAGLTLCVVALGALFASGIISFKRQPERYTYYEHTDPETGEIIEAVRDNFDTSFNPEKDI